MREIEVKEEKHRGEKNLAFSVISSEFSEKARREAGTRREQGDCGVHGEENPRPR